jgi:hypothetical protein
VPASGVVEPFGRRQRKRRLARAAHSVRTRRSPRARTAAGEGGGRNSRGDKRAAEPFPDIDTRSHWPTYERRAPFLAAAARREVHVPPTVRRGLKATLRPRVCAPSLASYISVCLKPTVFSELSAE